MNGIEMELTKEEKNELIIGSLLAGVFVILGIALLAWGFYLYNDLSNFLSTCEKTKGTIIEFVDLNRNRASEKAFVLPKVEYTAPDKNKYEFLAGITIWNDYEIGTEVTVLYNPDDFTDAKIDNFADLYFVPILPATIGFFAIFLPILTIYKHTKTLKP